MAGGVFTGAGVARVRARHLPQCPAESLRPAHGIGPLFMAGSGQ